MSKWQEKRLGDIISIKHGFAFKGEYISDEANGKVLVTPGNFNIGGGFKKTDKKFYYGEIPQDFILKPKDLIITMTDLSKNADTIGYSALIPNDNNIYLHNQRIGLVSVLDSNIDKHFIYWLLRTSSYQRQIANTSNGTNVKHTSPNRIYSYKCSIPDLATQEKIADILSTYDDLIENNNRRIEILEQMAQEIYKEWFIRFRFPGHEKVKFVNGIPEGWEVKKIKDIVDRKPFGTLYKESQVQEDGKVIVIDQSKKDYIGFHNNEPSHNADIDKPMILFGDHSCKYKIMITPFSLAENVIPFTSNDENLLTTYYLFYSINGIIQTTEYKRHWTDLTNKKIIISNINLQTKFEEKIKEFLLEIEQLSIINQNLIKQRDLLLPRLMSGKLEV